MVFSSCFPPYSGNITALAGGIIQSTGTVEVPGAVMQETGAPQISALKLIQVSNVSELQKAESWGWAVVEGKELDMYIYIYIIYIIHI